MNGLEQYKIPLLSLKKGHSEFSATLDETFFDPAASGCSGVTNVDIRGGRVNVAVSINRGGESDFDVRITLSGYVTVPCDRCLDDMDVDVKAEQRLEVKIVDHKRYNSVTDIDDEIIFIDERAPELPLGNIILECLVLSLPLRRVHSQGKCDAEMERRLAALQPKE